MDYLADFTAALGSGGDLIVALFTVCVAVELTWQAIKIVSGNRG